MLWNPAQLDTDGDGAGDECDGDDDGDGLGDAEDACLGTPLDQPTTEEGCSPEQFVALRCPPGSFRNHGQLVSCVAQTTNELVALGLLTAEERARIVSATAKRK